MASIEVWLHRRPDRSVPMADMYAQDIARLSLVDGPLGFRQAGPPPMLVDTGDYVVEVYNAKIPVRGLKCLGQLNSRAAHYAHRFTDEGMNDENLAYKFSTANKAIDYRQVLHENLPRVVEVFGAYHAHVGPSLYRLYYEQGGNNGFDTQGYAIETNAVYNALRADPTVNMDSRWFIYTLYPAQFWDGLLCQRALGYGPEEVIRRLNGKVPRMHLLGDGIYLVLNEDPTLTYETFVTMNEAIKPLLGLR